MGIQFPEKPINRGLSRYILELEALRQFVTLQLNPLAQGQNIFWPRHKTDEDDDPERIPGVSAPFVVTPVRNLG